MCPSDITWVIDGQFIESSYSQPVFKEDSTPVTSFGNYNHEGKISNKPT